MNFEFWQIEKLERYTIYDIFCCYYQILVDPEIILRIRLANERRRYIVTSSLVGWVHTQNDMCDLFTF